MALRGTMVPGRPRACEDEECEDEPLSVTVSHLLEESRMVLPGLQALFGFQLIVVFQPRFHELSEGEQLLHLLAAGASAVAVASIMTPAAYHRQAEPRSVSPGLVRLATRLLLFGMMPLAFAIAADFYVITQMVVHRAPVSAATATLVLVMFGSLWFGMPRATRAREWLTRDRGPGDA
jgi:hypothetical protein